MLARRISPCDGDFRGIFRMCSLMRQPERAKATLTTRSSVGTVTSTSKLKINPIVTFVSLGYRF